LPLISSSSLGYNFESAVNNTASLHICSVQLASLPPHIFSYFATAGFAAIKQKIMAEARGVESTIQDKGIRLCATSSLT
jgi:hypothetical protein